MTHMKQKLLGRVTLCAVAGALVVGLSASRATAFDDPPANKGKMVRDMTSAYEAGNYQKALDICEKLHKMEPDDSGHMYNMGCLNCLTGKKDKAYEWLEKAIDAGYKDVEQLVKDRDADFKTIRGEDRFRALLKRVRDGDQPGGEKREMKKKKPQADDDEDDADDDENDEEAKPAKPEKEDDDEKDADDGDNVNEQVQKLTQELIAAAEAKNYDKALKLALKAKKLADVGLTNYNVACMYSLLDKKEEAFEHLERAIKKGDFPRDIVEQVEGDTDLDNIRKDPRYKKMIEMAKKGAEKPAARGARNDDRGKKVKFEWKVTSPKGRDNAEDAPLIVVLHGFGSNMDEATRTWKKAAAKVGAVLLCPQGSYKLNETGFQWGGDMDAVEENVMAAIEKVAAEHKIDKHKIVLAGFSQGAAATWSLALRNPDTFHGIIPVCGRCDTRSDSAFEDEDIAKMRVCIMLGADDDKALNKSSKDAAKKMTKKGAKVKVNEFDGIGHAYPEKADDELAKALKFVLGE